MPADSVGAASRLLPTAGASAAVRSAVPSDSSSGVSSVLAGATSVLAATVAVASSDGSVSVWPTMIRFLSRIEFAASSASASTPVFFAIRSMLSPLRTTYTRAPSSVVVTTGAGALRDAGSVRATAAVAVALVVAAVAVRAHAADGLGGQLDHLAHAQHVATGEPVDPHEGRQAHAILGRDLRQRVAAAYLVLLIGALRAVAVARS